MRSPSTLIILFYIFSSLLSFASASHGVGNGGNAYVCYSDTDKQNVESVQLFDYVEQQSLNVDNTPINLGSKDLTIDQKIDIFMDRYGIDHSIADTESLRRFAKAIYYSIDFSSVLYYTLPTINDFNTSFKNKNANCFIKQFAIQSLNPINSSIKFIIDHNLFFSPHTSNDTKAGLIIHEALYRLDISRNKVIDSDHIRQINYLYASNINKTPMSSIQTHTSNIAFKPILASPNTYTECFAKTIYFNENSYAVVNVRIATPIHTNIYVTCEDTNNIILNNKLKMDIKAGALIYPKSLEFTFGTKTEILSIDSENINITLVTNTANKIIENISSVYFSNSNLYIRRIKEKNYSLLDF